MYQQPLEKPVNTRQWYPLVSFPQPQGRALQRLRASFSFHSCVGSTEETEDVWDLMPAVDLDLLACSETLQKCYGSSEYIHDTDEGFDINAGENTFPDDLIVFVVKPQEATACSAGVFAGEEPYGWAMEWTTVPE